jgi:hypothetical protein
VCMQRNYSKAFFIHSFAVLTKKIHGTAALNANRKSAQFVCLNAQRPLPLMIAGKENASPFNK